MGKIILFMAVLSLLAVPAAADQMELSVGGGYVLPVGETADLNTGSYVLGGNLGFFLSPNFVVGGELFIHDLGFTEEQQNSIAEEGITDASKTVSQYTASAKTLFNTGDSSFYTKFVGGFYESKVKATENGIPGAIAEKNFGLGAAFGYQIQGSGVFGAFAEGMYHHVFVDEGSLNFVDFRLGIMMKAI